MEGSSNYRPPELFKAPRGRRRSEPPDADVRDHLGQDVGVLVLGRNVGRASVVVMVRRRGGPARLGFPQRLDALLLGQLGLDRIARSLFNAIRSAAEGARNLRR